MGDEITFADLGIPFPLFEAPARLATRYAGHGACDLCGGSDRHVFALGIGDEVVSPCVSCGQMLAFSANEPVPHACENCGSKSPFPLAKCEAIRTCYECLREGKAAWTQDTEFGMVRYEDAKAGLTHGVPDLVAVGYDTVSVEDDWVRVRIAPEALIELVRTPSYTTWQGERWLFCCAQPMTYVGEWKKSDFQQFAPEGDGSAFFAGLCGGAEGLGFQLDDLDQFLGVIYAFHCKSCGVHRVHWDYD